MPRAWSQVFAHLGNSAATWFIIGLLVIAAIAGLFGELTSLSTSSNAGFGYF